MEIWEWSIISLKLGVTNLVSQKEWDVSVIYPLFFIKFLKSHKLGLSVLKRIGVKNIKYLERLRIKNKDYKASIFLVFSILHHALRLTFVRNWCHLFSFGGAFKGF